MSKEELIELAKVFNGFKADAVQEYSDKSEYLVALVLRKVAALTNITHLTNNNGGMLVSNTENHARFISAILLDYNAEVFVDTVIWVFRTYLSHGFKLEFWNAFLNIWIEAINEELAFEAKKEVIPLYEWMIAHIDDFSSLAKKQ